MKRPNIVFLFSDQHNAKFLGHRGHPSVQTPALDRLASEGVSFENALCQNPICSPSRMCFLTGQYAHNHGYFSAGGGPPADIPTFLGHFRRNGYQTMAAGKFHTPGRIFQQDLDQRVRICKHNSAYDAYLKEIGKLHLRDDVRYPEDDTEVGKCSQSCDGRPSSLPLEEGKDGWIARQGIRFMENALEEGRPFVSCIHFSKPHQIYSPSRESWDLYPEESISLPPNAEYDMSKKAPNLREQAEWWRTAPWPLFEPRTFEAARMRKLRGYLGCVTDIDRCVGMVLDWLDKKGLTEDTIVIYSSDHGDLGCEHGGMEKAPGISTDAVTRIPFIWRWPGKFQAGHRPTEIAESVDFSTTLASLCGLERLETSDGKDLSPILRGGAGEVHRIGVTENAWAKSIRKGNYRYVYYPREMFAEEYPDGFGELYDLEKDPWEMNNLYFETEFAGVVRELQSEFLDWLVTTTRVKSMQSAKFEMNPRQVIQLGTVKVLGDGKLPPPSEGSMERTNPFSPNPGINYL